MISVGYYNINLESRTLPQDVVAFAEGITHPCFALDQVYGIDGISENVPENRRAAEQLTDIIRRTKRLYLWWD